MKLVVVVLMVVGGALWAFDKFLARMSRKLGSTGQGPPWAREARRRISRIPAILEAAIGVGVPVLYSAAGPWLIGFDSPRASAALSAHQGAAIGYAATASGALAAWLWARPSSPRWAAAIAGALFAGMAGGGVWGILAQAEGLGLAGVLPFAAAFVMYRRGREAQRAAGGALPARPWRAWSGLGGGAVAVVTFIGWFFPGVG